MTTCPSCGHPESHHQDGICFTLTRPECECTLRPEEITRINDAREVLADLGGAS